MANNRQNGKQFFFFNISYRALDRLEIHRRRLGHHHLGLENHHRHDLLGRCHHENLHRGHHVENHLNTDKENMEGIEK